MPVRPCNISKNFNLQLKIVCEKTEENCLQIVRQKNSVSTQVNFPLQYHNFITVSQFNLREFARRMGGGGVSARVRGSSVVEILVSDLVKIKGGSGVNRK